MIQGKNIPEIALHMACGKHSDSSHAIECEEGKNSRNILKYLRIILTYHVGVCMQVTKWDI